MDINRCLCECVRVYITQSYIWEPVIAECQQEIKRAATGRTRERVISRRAKERDIYKGDRVAGVANSSESAKDIYMLSSLRWLSFQVMDAVFFFLCLLAPFHLSFYSVSLCISDIHMISLLYYYINNMIINITCKMFACFFLVQLNIEEGRVALQDNKPQIYQSHRHKHNASMRAPHLCISVASLRVCCSDAQHQLM